MNFSYEDIWFQVFILTFSTIVFNIFLKMLSRPDNQKPLDLSDFGIGYELAVTALIFFINDYITEVTSPVGSSDEDIYNKIIYSPLYAIAFLILLIVLTYYTRKRGWRNNKELKLSAILLQDLFGIISLILVFVWIRK